MKLVHSIGIKVFVKSFSDEEKTAQTLVSFLPKDFIEQKIKIEEESVKLENEERMKIYRVKTDKNRHNKHIISTLKNILLKKQLETSLKTVDEEGFLYIRLDKKKLEEEGKAELIKHGDCYHFKILLAAFPKTKEKAIDAAKKLLIE